MEEILTGEDKREYDKTRARLRIRASGKKSEYGKIRRAERREANTDTGKYPRSVPKYLFTSETILNDLQEPVVAWFWDFEFETYDAAAVDVSLLAQNESCKTVPLKFRWDHKICVGKPPFCNPPKGPRICKRRFGPEKASERITIKVSEIIGKHEADWEQMVNDWIPESAPDMGSTVVKSKSDEKEDPDGMFAKPRKVQKKANVIPGADKASSLSTGSLSAMEPSSNLCEHAAAALLTSFVCMLVLIGFKRFHNVLPPQQEPLVHA
eukprot:gnl/MRDRNA2_/MRDRNA2_156178_c0_seq1.p1 gnl/MRDRNA2_/MRDRNA2_156178_c0~~gnl/MRDRNA2_/MRDRNA2_156178_c0_seq1.p1  ORF type:complete len:266 (-),score=48.00 gnl/MRDRNA2_/MRDRNA2_156178_c0_seq1:189-986(-)